MESTSNQDSPIAINDDSSLTDRQAQGVKSEDAGNGTPQKPVPFESTHATSEPWHGNSSSTLSDFHIAPLSVPWPSTTADDPELELSSDIGQSTRAEGKIHLAQQDDQAPWNILKARNPLDSFQLNRRLVENSITPVVETSTKKANQSISRATGYLGLGSSDGGNEFPVNEPSGPVFGHDSSTPHAHADFNDDYGSAIGAWDTGDASTIPYPVPSVSGYGTVPYYSLIDEPDSREIPRDSSSRPSWLTDSSMGFDHASTPTFRQVDIPRGTHFCDLCNRVPFHTSSDLLIHKKGYHGILDVDDGFFLCKGSECLKSYRIWTELDNFKRHCRRTHPKEDLDDLVKKSVFNQYAILASSLHGSSVHDTSNDLSFPKFKQNSHHTVQIQWDFLGFLREQFGGYKEVALGSIVTLSGTAKLAQATTAGEYLEWNWPRTGPACLAALQQAAESPGLQSSITWPELDDVEIAVTLSESTGEVSIDIRGVIDNFSSITEPLSWIGSTFQFSTEKTIRYSIASIDGDHLPDYTITFSHHPLTEDELNDANCWHPLFDHGVIARGFPVMERSGQKGLELSLYMMTALGGVQRAFVYQGGVILKGFSAAFVPIERYNDSIQWHMVQNEDGKRLTYQEVVQRCPNRSMLKDVSLECLKYSRAILGWCSTVQGRLGTADFDYKNIDYAEGLSDASRDVTITGANLGLSEHATMGLSVAFGRKGSKKHIARSGTFKTILDCAEDTPVVLFDPSKPDRRAWLVSASDAILHIVHTQNTHRPFKVNGEQVELCHADPEKNGWKAGRDAILRNASVKLEDSEWPDERAIYFRDRFAGLWSDFEARLDMVEQSIPDGIKVRGTWRHFLRGWQYMDLADRASSFGYKETTLHGTHGAWVHLVHEIDALVLFASGLQDLFRPLSGTRICPKWRTVPTEKDYLTTGVPMLKRLFTKAGSRTTRNYLAGRLQWHKGCKLFEDYDCCGQYQCDCNRQQGLFYDEWNTIGNLTRPDSLALEQDSGAVVFGKGPPCALLRQPKPRQTELYSQKNTNFVHNEWVSSKSSDESIHTCQSSKLEDRCQTTKTRTPDNSILSNSRSSLRTSTGRSSSPSTPPEEASTKTVIARKRARDRLSQGNSVVDSLGDMLPKQTMASICQDVVYHKVTTSHGEVPKRLRRTGKLRAISPSGPSPDHGL
ncbi:hypothetical protein MMC11_008613 [Xylographa trunciseda]|nr:hypothetical protein [Xylographa trunciseda]